MEEKKFDPQKLKKLNNPQRLKDISPDFIWEKLGIENVKTAVEIGAGTAFFSIPFLKLSKASKLYACDISDVMIAWVKENITPKHPEIVPIKTEEVALPLEAESADLVFTINLHHELHHPDQTLLEAYRILRPGGKIFIVDWAKESPTGPPPEIRYLPEQVKKQMENSGFKEVEFYSNFPMHFLVIGEKKMDRGQ